MIVGPRRGTRDSASRGVEVKGAGAESAVLDKGTILGQEE